jgi:hypothetical protein
MMKKIYGLTIASAIAVALSGCSGNSSPETPAPVAKAAGITIEQAANLDEREVCNVAKLGIETVIANAKLYNDQAIKEKVEFRRLGINNSDLIVAVQEGIAAKSTEVIPKDFKGKDHKGTKNEQKFEINYAAHRACTFGLAALQYKHEGKSTWRNEVPGDGFKY